MIFNVQTNIRLERIWIPAQKDLNVNHDEIVEVGNYRVDVTQMLLNFSELHPPFLQDDFN